MACRNWPPLFWLHRKGVGFSTPLFTLANIKDFTPPTFFTEAFPNKQGLPSGLKSLAAGTAGVVVGAAGAAMLTGLGKKGTNSGNVDHDHGKEE